MHDPNCDSSTPHVAANQPATFDLALQCLCGHLMTPYQSIKDAWVFSTVAANWTLGCISTAEVMEVLARAKLQRGPDAWIAFVEHFRAGLEETMTKTEQHARPVIAAIQAGETTYGLGPNLPHAKPSAFKATDILPPELLPALAQLAALLGRDPNELVAGYCILNPLLAEFSLDVRCPQVLGFAREVAGQADPVRAFLQMRHGPIKQAIMAIGNEIARICTFGFRKAFARPSREAASAYWPSSSN